MAKATLSVTFAGPLVTVQDTGRRGRMRFGVPASGPMDRLAFDAGQAALRNGPGGAAIEVSLGGLVLTCKSGAVTVAVTGGDFAVDTADGRLAPWTVLTLREGARLSLRAGAAGSWAYLGFAGDLARPAWLGSRATHAASGFGGGAVRSGDMLTIADARVEETCEGDIVRPNTDAWGTPFDLVLGPQDALFAPSAREALLQDRFAVSDAYDRMGMRLSDVLLPYDGALSIPSEPVVKGSIQVSGDHVPTVLLADHQTTGGYPKIATVASYGLDRLAQLRAGDGLRFRAVEAAQAQATARQVALQRSAYLDHVAIPRGTLAERLMRENLIHGFLPD
ncbi:MAG: biotin-dependent carboxyltransferase family protein [Pseudomonadota bacterium]